MEKQHAVSPDAQLFKGIEKQGHDDPQATDVESGSLSIKQDRGTLHASISSRKLQVSNTTLEDSFSINSKVIAD